jgi:hypothetical protein
MTGYAGLAAFVLLFGGQAFMQTVGTAEPAFDAPAAEIQRYFETRDPTLFSIGSYLSVLGLIALLWFVCGMYAQLRADADRHEWLPTVALASGVAMVGSTLPQVWQVAVSRVGEGLEPQLGRLAFDMDNLRFANAWVALGSFAVAAGWAMLPSRSTPRWLSWWAIAAGAGLIVSRAAWTTYLWFFPYALFWLWVLVVSVRSLTGAQKRAVIAASSDT